MLGGDPSAPTREWRERIGIVLQQCRMRPGAHGARDARAVRRLLPRRWGSRRRSTTSASPTRPDARAPPLRRSAAPARRRRRADRRSGAALPRRADDRLRPLGQAPVLGRDRGPQASSARPSSSPPTTWTRPSGSPTGWRSSPRPDRRRGRPDELGRPRATARVDPLPGQPGADDLPATCGGAAGRRTASSRSRGVAGRGAAPAHRLGARRGRSSSRGWRSAARASRTSTSSSPARPRTTIDEPRRPRPRTSSASTRRSSGATRRRCSSPSRCR